MLIQFFVYFPTNEALCNQLATNYEQFWFILKIQPALLQNYWLSFVLHGINRFFSALRIIIQLSDISFTLSQR